MELDLNPVLTPVRDLGEFIREQRLAAQISVRALAAKAGVSNPYLSQVERGLRRPSAEILAQIAHGLSISVETMLAKAGILEPSDAPEVVTAIRADPVLTERQKAVLLDIYAALRNQAQAGVDPVSRSTPRAAQPVPAAGTGVDTDPAVLDAAVLDAAVLDAAGLAGSDPAGSDPARTDTDTDTDTVTVTDTDTDPADPRVPPTTPIGITPVPEGEHHAAV
ncbi:helix-turn-helix domain-containing protein [Nakamurella sp.]|uniref:helix-turn-helix domain-containing protein n=1 Tax=Nakamurella sp. TaxID=1869182 RepID=UPI003B3BC0E4